MYIKQKHLTIRNATVNDANQLAKWWNDGKIMAHAGFPDGLGTSPEKIANSIINDTDETRRRLIIEIDNTASGEMDFTNKGNKTAEIGIKICEASKREKGYGTVLLSMLISALFNELNYEKIILDTNEKNVRARHVYEKLGFRESRINTDSWKDQLGELQSSVDYELKKEDFIDFAG